jgi:hypothetical protein
MFYTLPAQGFVRDHTYLLTHTLKPGTVDEWHMDNGPEFTSGDMDRLAAEMQHQQSFSVPEVHEMNPSAERCWRVLLRSTRAMLAHAGGDMHQAQLWPSIMHATVQRHNNIYSYGNQPPAIPIIKAGGASAAMPLRKFKVNLCDCHVAVKDVELYDKISPRRILAIHLGYNSRRDSGYFVYIPHVQRITITTASDVDFLEHSLISSSTPSLVSALSVPTFACSSVLRGNIKGQLSHNILLPKPPPPARPRIPPLPMPSLRAAPVPAPAPAAAPSAPPPAARPSLAVLAAGLGALAFAPAAAAQLVTVTSTAAADIVFLAGSNVGETYAFETAPGPILIPRTFHEAVADPICGDKWRAACYDDIRGNYTELKTWELVKSIPTGRKPIKGKWVFLVKYKTDGSVDKFKARYVGCGYSKVPGVDYTDTFRSTLRLESLRAFLSGASVDDDNLLEADVVKAFPSDNWDDTDLYLMQPPSGYENSAYAACRLLRPLEGTKQAGNLWMTGNAKTITALGFERCPVKPNAWRKTISKATTIRMPSMSTILSFASLKACAPKSTRTSSSRTPSAATSRSWGSRPAYSAFRLLVTAKLAP